jgi:[ribosomal protein S5]-alanine N-acetyltransferase
MSQLIPTPFSIPTSFGLVRPYRLDDAEALVKYANNRKVWLNLRDGFPHPYTLEDARMFLQNACQPTPPTLYAIATPQEAIGGIGITINKDVHRLTAELGYWLGEPFWGKGYMTESVLKFTDAMFNQFGLVRIYAEPYAFNAASAHVLEKAGFILEGRMACSVIKDGKIGDQLLYAKVKKQPSFQI